MTGGGVRIVLSSSIFVFTGLLQTVCIQSVLYSGGGDRSTFLLAIPNYLGILLVYFLGARSFKTLDRFGVWSSGGKDTNRVHLSVYNVASDVKPRPIGFFGRLFHPERRKLYLLAINEMGGFLSGLTGLAIAGSGLYQVVFSGGTVFTALLSTFFLKKRLTIAQWLFVAIITAGLMVTAEQVTHSSTEAGAASLVSGVAFVLVSCLFYSANYVIAEYFLDREQSDAVDEEPKTLPKPSGLDLCLHNGGSCLVAFGVYVIIYTIPNWNSLVTSSIERHHGNTTLIMEEYLYLTVASFFHAISHYDIVATVGAVPIGVLNAMRAVSVFGASSLMFCSHQASQCYNSRKGVATAIVIFGALGYSAASAAASKPKSKVEQYPRMNRAEHVPRITARKLRPVTSQSVVGHKRSMSIPSLHALYGQSGRSLATWLPFTRKKSDSVQPAGG